MRRVIVAISVSVFGLIAFGASFLKDGVTYVYEDNWPGPPTGYKHAASAELAPNGQQTGLNVMGSFEQTVRFSFVDENGAYKNVTLLYQHVVTSVRSAGVGVYGTTEEGMRLVQSISLPETISKVNPGCFRNFSGLRELYIPDSVKEIGTSVCWGCSSLERVHISEAALDFGSAESAFRGCSSLKSVDLPQAMTSIGFDMFSGCSSLESILIPNQVTSIGANAFNGCSALKSIDIPNQVTSIGASAFNGCSALKSIDIPAQASSIGNYAFYKCSSLTSITIRAKNVTIGTDAFYGCNSPEVSLPADYRLSRVFPDFYTNIKKVNILGTESGVCDFAFTDCRNLSEVVISEGVSKIGESAFENCRRLESVTIPASVQKIQDYAFYGCGGLKEVEYAGEMPEVGIGAFTGTAVASPSTQASVALTVTNVVVQYVLNSVRPEFALPPSSDTGFVNVIAEVKGGSVAIPSSWSTAYPKFTTKFGTDFTKALAMQTGKKDGAGNPMFVWQDYVAGTDPTDETDVFTASITIVDGKVQVSYSPELDDARKALRKYTIWGKAKLTDKDWSVVGEGEEGNFNFFKVTVEMK